MEGTSLWGALPGAQGTVDAAEHALEHETKDNKTPSTDSSTLDGEKHEQIHPVLSGDIDGNIAASGPEVTQLARRITGLSQQQSHGEGINTFHDSTNPALDPRSGKFNPRAWVENLVAIASRDPERYPGRTAGLSFRNLKVHGFGSPTDYQKTFGNYPLEIGSIFNSITGRGKSKIQILRDFDGLIRSGEMLVVLGRPGSGCSTLLKTISGETHGFHIDPVSEINYQGIPMKTMHKDFRGESVYQAEVDVHFPQLTVGQTLAFAAEARAPSNRLPGVTRKQYAEHMRDVIMAVFGLTHTLNTKVGNDYIRGVSGGERKRVSIAEAALGRSPLQCWDNSTRGLDSATALEFVKTLRISTSLAGSTAVVAIYQASQAIYDVFDKVVVLYEGRQIYFGHKDAAKKFFIDMGFHCPERATTGDFLTSLTSPGERRAREGFEARVPRTPDEFAARWKSSEDHARLMADIDAFEREFPIGKEQVDKFVHSRRAEQAKHQRARSPYLLSIPMQIKLNVRRGFMRLRGDMSLALSGAIGNFIMAMIIGSVFYNLPHDTGSFYSRGALLFFAILLNAFSSSLEILTLYAQRPIVEKQAKYAFYHPYTEAVASMICDLPNKVVTSLAFNLTLYFMTNLRRTPGAFFTFYLFNFVCILAMSMVFRTIGALSRSLAQAMAPAAVFILSLIIYTGFAIPVKYMHPWFRWINWIDPVAYAFEALMINEFSGQRYLCSVFVPEGPGYGHVRPDQRICSTAGASPGADFVDGTVYLKTNFGYTHAHLWRNLGILFGFVFFGGTVYLTAAEYISAKRSKGEVLLFRRGQVPPIVTSTDEERKMNDRLTAEDVVMQDKGQENELEKVLSTAIQKQTAVFHWDGVNYDIKIKGEPRRLLDDVDGWVKPGTLTALMGASGAGKTTLLDVLASRTTMGVVSGGMYVDGRLRNSGFQRKTGYVQQQDLHLATTTVREALIFSALLRQPKSVPRKEKIAYVEEVIKILEMGSYADAVVGVPGEGLNVEQRKRLTIAVEMAAKPELLLFLDEPTSGLDSQTAWSILSLLKKLADNGQAILCTIHQPSALLFQEFDRLLFLASGGRTVYYGDIGHNSTTLTSYFERNGSRQCGSSENPAEWMLDVIGAAPGSQNTIDWPQVWRESPEKAKIKQQLAEMKEELASTRQFDNSQESLREFAAPVSLQFTTVTKRVFEQYWRTPSYLYSKVLLCASSALFIGFSFWMSPTSLQGLQNQLFAIFMLLTIFGNLVQQIMPHFVVQRALFEVRERPSKTYSWKVFVTSNIVVELPWQTLMAVIIFFCWYYPIGMYRNAIPEHQVHERGGLMFLLIWAFMIFASTFTHMVIAGIETAETGGNIAQLLFSLTLIFCGVLASPSVFPHFWIFMYRVSPFTYLVDGFLSVGLANTHVVCSNIEYSHFNPASGTCGEYMKNYITAMGGYLQNPNATKDCSFCSASSTNVFLAGLSSHYSNRWRNFGIMWAFILFNVCGAVFFYWLARVPKKSKEQKKMEKMEQQQKLGESKE